jgi:hypothetical protein
VTPNIHYENREIEGERLEFPNDAIYWIGPNATLRGCTLVLRVTGRWLHLLSAQLIDCTLHAKSELNALRWSRVKLKGCRFKGRFTGNDFGFREDSIDKWKVGGIEDCDFSEARLHGCRFSNCDMNSLRLPRWPCFTLMDPLAHVVELSRREWPGRFGILIQALAKNPEGTVAESWHAPTVAKMLGTTAEELRAALEGQPWVFM